MDFYKYYRKLTNRLDSALSESTKDFLYRNTGFFAPNPPKHQVLGNLTSEYQRRIDKLETVCLFMGPNRNLTTLTASVLAMHPNCQVMSHGGQRVLPVKDLNFLDGYTEEKFRNFCHFALVMSQTRGKGGLGGSITITHPFRHHPVIRRTYRKRFGRAMIKEEVKCLVWKEAHMVDDYVRQNHIDLDTLLKNNERLRLLLPIRNPLHVAQSFFVNEGFRKTFYGQFSPNDFKPFLKDILDRMQRTIRLQKSNSDQVDVFFEYDISADLLKQLAAFLRISPDQRWIEDSLRCFDVKPPAYSFSQEIIDYFEQQITELFGFDPACEGKFRHFMPATIHA
jgi:hypothetical protein